MKNNTESFDLEKVYDEQIAPLMTQIINICKEHKLPMFASFLYKNDSENEDDGCCTTNLMFKERPIPKEFLALAPSIFSTRGLMLRMRVERADGSVEETVVLP